MMRASEIFVGVLDQALRIGTLVRFPAEGDSMYPTIRNGEAITVAAISADEVVRGDVLLCRHGTRVLAHRVVDVTTHGTDRVFHLRGDAKAACDAPVGTDALVGKVISVCRNGRRVSLCGPVARLRYRARAAASRAKAFVWSSATRRSSIAALPSNGGGR